MGELAQILTAIGDSEPDRRIALKLHALHEEDRNWILSKLDSTPRRILEGLLLELNELGFAQLPELRTAAPEHPASQAIAEDELAPVRTVDDASAAAIWNAIYGEPSLLRCEIIHARKWRWQEELLQAHPQLIWADRPCESSHALTSRAREALISALAQKLANTPDSLETSTLWAVDAPPSIRPKRLLSQRLRELLRWRR